MKLSADSNVLIYAVDGHEADRHQIALTLMAQATNLDFVVAGQAIGEYLNFCRRRRRARFDELQSVARLWSSLYAVMPTRWDHLQRAAHIAARYDLQFWDSVILAVVATDEVDILLSEDMQDGQMIEGVTILNPFAPANRQRLETLGLLTPSP